MGALRFYPIMFGRHLLPAAILLINRRLTRNAPVTVFSLHRDDQTQFVWYRCV